MVRFQNILIFPIDFNDSIQLLGHLGAEKWQTFGRKAGVRHSRHKENIRSHTKLPKSQILCMHLFLQSGFGG